MTTNATAITGPEAPETAPDESPLEVIQHAVEFAHYCVLDDEIWALVWSKLKETPFAPEGSDPDEVRADVHSTIDHAAFTVSPLGVALTLAVGRARMEAQGVRFPDRFGERPSADAGDYESQAYL